MGRRRPQRRAGWARARGRKDLSALLLSREIWVHFKTGVLGIYLDLFMPLTEDGCT